VKKTSLFLCIALAIVTNLSFAQTEHSYTNEELKQIFNTTPGTDFPSGYSIADYDGRETMAIQNNDSINFRYITIYRQPGWIKPTENIRNAFIEPKAIIYPGTDSTYEEISFYYHDKLFHREKIKVGIDTMRHDNNLVINDCCSQLIMGGAENTEHNLLFVFRQYDFSDQSSALFLNGEIVFKSYYIAGILPFSVCEAKLWNDKFIVRLSDYPGRSFYAVLNPRERIMIFPNDIQKIEEILKDYSVHDL